MAVWLVYSQNRPDCQKLQELKCQEQRACAGRRWRFDAAEFRGCLFAQVSRQSFAWLEAFYFFDARGMWPNPGGWQDQPGILLQAFTLIEGERRKINRIEANHEQSPA